MKWILSLAIFSGYFIASNASANQNGKELHKLLCHFHSETKDTILELVADPSTDINYSAPCGSFDDETSIFQTAAEKSEHSVNNAGFTFPEFMAVFLAREDLDPNRVYSDLFKGETVLNRIIRKNMYQPEMAIAIVSELLKHPKIDPNVGRKSTLSGILHPLVQAMQYRNFDLFKLLLNHSRTDPNFCAWIGDRREGVTDELHKIDIVPSLGRECFPLIFSTIWQRWSDSWRAYDLIRSDRRFNGNILSKAGYHLFSFAVAAGQSSYFLDHIAKTLDIDVNHENPDGMISAYYANSFNVEYFVDKQDVKWNHVRTSDPRREESILSHMLFKNRFYAALRIAHIADIDIKVGEILNRLWDRYSPNNDTQLIEIAKVVFKRNDIDELVNYPASRPPLYMILGAVDRQDPRLTPAMTYVANRLLDNDLVNVNFYETQSISNNSIFSIAMRSNFFDIITRLFEREDFQPQPSDFGAANEGRQGFQYGLQQTLEHRDFDYLAECYRVIQRVAYRGFHDELKQILDRVDKMKLSCVGTQGSVEYPIHEFTYDLDDAEIFATILAGTVGPYGQATSYTGRTLIHSYFDGSNFAKLNLGILALLLNLPDLDVNARDSFSRPETALTRAVRNKNVTVGHIELLLSNPRVDVCLNSSEGFRNSQLAYSSEIKLLMEEKEARCN